FFFRSGERSGTSAMAHCVVALALIALAANGLRLDELIVCSALLAICALALGNAVVGVAASISALSIGALLIGGPAALTTLPDPLLRWALLPAAALAAVFVLRAADRFDLRALPSF